MKQLTNHKILVMMMSIKNTEKNIIITAARTKAAAAPIIIPTAKTATVVTKATTKAIIKAVNITHRDIKDERKKEV